MAFLLITLMTLWTPPFSDDWHYGFIFEKEGPLMQRPVQTLSDVIESLYHHYFVFNGRCTPHFFVILFDGILGHKAFAVCNGAMFVLMLHLFCLNFAGRKENYFIVASIVMASIVILLPGFSHAMLWMSGACNYLWNSVFILFFHYLLGKDIRKRWWGLLFLYGIIAGNTHEGIMIGLSVGYAVYYLSHFKELTAQRWVMLIGLAIGVAFVVFAPSIWARATHATYSSSVLGVGIGQWWRFAIMLLLSLRITYIALFMMLYRRKMPHVWGVAVIVLLVFNSMVRSGYTVQIFGLEICSLIIVLQLLRLDRIKSRYSMIMTAVAVIVLIVPLPLCAKSYHRYQQIDQYIRSSKEQNVIVFADEPTEPIPFITGRFVLECWSEIPIQKPRPFPCGYYSKESIHVLPSSLEQLLMTGKIGKEFDLHTPYPYYVCEWDGSDDVVGKMTYYPSPYANYPLLGKIAQFTTTEQDVAGSYAILTINSKRYLFIEKALMLADRIRSIEVRSKEK